MRLRRYTVTAREGLGMVEDIATLALVEMRGELRTRLKYVFALLAALALGLLTLFFTGALLLVIAWETPYRVPTAVALAIAPIIVAAIVVIMIRERWRNDQWLTATRSELREFYRWLKAML
jgi:uncharacterized membrane protein YqjE